MRSIGTVAVVGAGAMGAMYASFLARAGVRVWLVADGERAARLRAEGLTVNGEPLVADVVEPTAGGGHAPADLVLVAVKDRHLAEAVDLVAPLVGEPTTFLSVLNGLDSEELLAHRYGAERVLLCVALAMDAQREGGDVFFRQPGRLLLGCAPGIGTPDRLTAAQDVLSRAGLAWETPEDMRRSLWWKFMVNVGINQASAVLRAPYGAFQSAGSARSLMLALMHEVLAVAPAEGVDLGESDLAAWDAVLSGQPPQGWTSMHQDVVAGRRSEVESFAGRVVALGVTHGIPTPYNQALLWILRGLEGR